MTHCSLREAEVRPELGFLTAARAEANVAEERRLAMLGGMTGIGVGIGGVGATGAL